MQPLLKLVRWEEEIISFLVTDMQLSRFDAQGMLEAHSSFVRQAWKDLKSARQTADQIIQLNTHEDTAHD